MAALAERYRRDMRRLLVSASSASGALLATATVALTAPTAASAAAPLRLPDAKALGRVGVAVDWPLRAARTTATPGARLIVRVRPLRGAAASSVNRAVRLRLVRLRAGSLPAATLASRRVRSGRFVVRLGFERGRVYELRLTVARRTWRSRVIVPAAPRASTPKPPAPVPAPNGRPYADPAADCAATRGSFALEGRITRATILPGESNGFRITNSGGTCEPYTYRFALERLRADGWRSFGESYAFTQLIEYLHPGQSIGGGQTVPYDAPLGRYRFSAPFGLAYEFDVVDPCPTVGFTATTTATLAATTIRAGTPVRGTIVNDGPGCLSYDGSLFVERKTAGGGWEGTPYSVPAPPVMLALFPHVRRDVAVAIPADAPAGTYRLSIYGAPAPLEFEVAAPS